MKRTLILAAALFSVMASPAFAHLNPAEHGSFAAGFSHPRLVPTTSLLWLLLAFGRRCLAGVRSSPFRLALWA